MRNNPELHYLDNAATTRVAPNVADAIHKTMLENWGNPSSLYTPGHDSFILLGRARSAIAKSLGADPGEVFFTGCGSESNNIAILGAVYARKNWGKKIVVSGFEHPSVGLPIARLAEEGFEVAVINPTPAGELDTDAFVAAVDKNTCLAACIHVNNETGARVDVARLAAAIKQKNPRTAVHIDGVQAWLRVETPLQNIDSYTVSGHKIHAPKGVGALYLRRGHNIRPPFLGGGQEKGTGGGQDQGVRPGTENLPYAVGLATAASTLYKNRGPRSVHVAALNRQLRQGLNSLPGIAINSPDTAVAEVLNFSTNCIKSEPMLHFLEEKGVYVSSGSACSRGAASHTLGAMGLDALRIDTALRISFCGDNTPEDVTALLKGLAEGINTLARIGS